MKRLLLLMLVVAGAFSSRAQHLVELIKLYDEPKVHVSFEGYTIHYTIRDINRAMVLLAETGDNSYGRTSFLDSTKDYYVELYPGYKTEYSNRLQLMLQERGIGAYLITAGRAVIENAKHKKLKGVLVDIQPYLLTEEITDVKIYDMNSNRMVFNGQMSAAMYQKDFGLD